MTSRIGNALALYVYALLGVFLLVAPWTPVWDQAVRGLLPLSVGAWAGSGWVRGLTSGLGALDLAVAAQFAARLWFQGASGPPGSGSD